MSNAAVVNGELKHVSPSQITTFQRCKRLWFYQKVLKLRVPYTGAQAIGVEIHSQLEKYYLTGVDPTEPRALAALPLLPKRSNCVLVESALDTPNLTIAGVRCDGRIDLVEFANPSSPVIIDFKSRSSFKWNKTSEELVKDLQLLSYAAWAAGKWPQAEQFRLVHVYLLTTAVKPPAVVEGVVPRQAVLEFKASLEPVVEEMRLTAKFVDESQAIRSFDVDPDETKACRDWGGCAFIDRCGKDFDERFFMRFGPQEDTKAARKAAREAARKYGSDESSVAASA